MRYDYETEEDSLQDCGGVAGKKIGRIWVCDFHYAMFRDSLEDEGEGVTGATDSTNITEDDLYTYTEYDGEDEDGDLT